MLKVVSSSRPQFVPLKSVTVHVNIHSFAADVCIKQVFVNNEENPIEAVYCFPVEEQAAIYSFEATLDNDRKIQAQIKEKKKAQREYCDALRKGHGAFLLEQNEKSNDIFTISVGSLKPQSKCEIEIHYVQELELIDDGQRIQYVLPTTIAPRYSSVSVGDGHVKSPGSTTSKYVQSAPYTIAFFCSISSLPIASVISPSHTIQVISQDSISQYPTVNVSLQQENTHLDRDIILNIDLKQEQVLTYTLVEKQAIMVSLVPTLELCDSSNKMEKVNCEYIFIVDCSGSMAETDKIGYARQAMSVFLKSLPIGSYFNIFRFGSTFEQFHKTQITVEYNEESAKEASDYITNHMEADLGGTELYSVLSHLHTQPSRMNYSRQLFILTDGEIEDVDQVLRLCHSMSNTTRIFSFGLGSSPSRALVKGLARVTNGSYVFIPPNTHVDTAVAQQLDKALEPCLVNIKIQCHFDNNELKDYRISPKILPPIHVKQRLNVYLMMPKNIEGTLQGSIEFLTDKNNLIERVTFNETQPSSSLIATRLAAKSIITDLQTDDFSSTSSRQTRFNQDEQAEKRQELINISIQHQILSPFTAFVGVETRTEEEIGTTSSGNMTLREVPIEIRANADTLDDEDEDCDDCDESVSPNIFCGTSAFKFACNNDVKEQEQNDNCELSESSGDEDLVLCRENSSKRIYRCRSAKKSFYCDNDVEEEEENDSCELSESFGDEEGDYSNKIAVDGKCDDSDESAEDEECKKAFDMDELYNMPVKNSQVMTNSEVASRYAKSSKRCRSRSRSRSPNRCRSNSPERENTANPSDIVRQIIELQNFNGLWSINHIKQLITLLQSTATAISKDDHLEKIINDYKDKDNDVVLSMIIMLVFMKYFTDDEPLWKPIMKKCAKAMETRLGKVEYHEITDKIKQLV